MGLISLLIIMQFLEKGTHHQSLGTEEKKGLEVEQRTVQSQEQSPDQRLNLLSQRRVKSIFYLCLKF